MIEAVTMRPFRFLQFSDVHLDSPLFSSRLALPPEKREQRRREIKALIPEACRLARERGVDAVLIPGDLWDDEAVSGDTVNMLIEHFRSIAPIPVYIAPGNHDFYSPGSKYDAAFLRGRGLPSWPGNVHIFSEGEFRSVIHSYRPDVAITGLAFRRNVRTHERLLAPKIPRPNTPLTILLFHGSRLGWERFESRTKMITAPFSEEELLAQGFSYAAIGHYHSYSDIRDGSGAIRGAYAGCPAGQALDETGEKFVLVGEVSPGGGVPSEKLEKIVLDSRRIIRVTVEITGLLHSEAVRRKVIEGVESSGARGEDLLYVEVRGRYPKGEIPDLGFDPFADRFFHWEVAMALQPDHDLGQYWRDPGKTATTEGRFVQEMLRRIQAAPSEEERSRYIRALYYGLDAFTFGRIEPRYEGLCHLGDAIAGFVEGREPDPPGRGGT